MNGKSILILTALVAVAAIAGAAGYIVTSGNRRAGQQYAEAAHHPGRGADNGEEK